MSHQFTVDTQHVPNVRGHLTASPSPEEDLRWMPTTQEETAVIAHLRKWTHLATLCEICRQESLLFDTRQTLAGIVEGPRRWVLNG
jgi:hypothetical protein